MPRGAGLAVEFVDATSEPANLRQQLGDLGGLIGFEDPLVIPVPGDDSALQEEPVMAEPTANQGLAAELIGQSMGQLSGTAAVAQNNFVTVNKALDYMVENAKIK